MENSPSFTLTNESITIIWKGKPYTVRKGAPNFHHLRAAIIAEKWDDIPNHLTVSSSLQDWAKGKFTLSGDRFLHEGKELPHGLNQRIVSMASKGDNPESLFKFWEKLQKNPSWRSVDQLYPFLQHQGIPITEDGCFLAYKAVKSDYSDVHSGNFSNKPGTINEMPRNQISDDPRQACHEGFHVGALEYARTFHTDGRIVVCKVDPADVVCVPYDSSQQKMRVSKYEVIGNHNGDHLPSTTYKEDTYEERPEEQEDDESSEEEDHSDDVNPEMIQEDDEGYDPETDPLIDSEAENEDVVNLAEAREKVIKKARHEEEKRKSKRGFTKLDKMDMKELMNQSIDELRRYAGKGLQIIGASKILGGKTALVAKILEVRE